MDFPWTTGAPQTSPTALGRVGPSREDRAPTRLRRLHRDPRAGPASEAPTRARADSLRAPRGPQGLPQRCARRGVDQEASHSARGEATLERLVYIVWGRYEKS